MPVASNSRRLPEPVANYGRFRAKHGPSRPVLGLAVPESNGIVRRAVHIPFTIGHQTPRMEAVMSEYPNRPRWWFFAVAVLIALAAGFFAYNAGVSHGAAMAAL